MFHQNSTITFQVLNIEIYEDISMFASLDITTLIISKMYIKETQSFHFKITS